MSVGLTSKRGIKIMCLSKETSRAIHAALAEKKMSQTDLAGRLGVSPSYINNILAGRQRISMIVADRIVAALGCRIRVQLEKKS